jgi:hypothetical protein
MEKLFFFIAFVVFFYSCSSQVVDNSAEIKFETISHDYGTLAQGGNGEYDFKFTNTGKVPLILKDVSSSCGCTVPVWTKEPINPGKTGSIKVKYDTNGIGNFIKTISVISNAKKSPVELTIKGNVTEKSL